MILLGFYTFTRRRLFKAEIPDNIKPLLEPGDTLAFRQQVAHIFWIPIFPLARQWMIKRKGDWMKPNEEMQAYLKQSLGKMPIPWYSFSFIMVAILGILGFFAFEKYEKIWLEKRRFKHDKIWIAKKEERIFQPQKGDVLVVGPGDYGSICKSNIFVVLDYNEDSVQLRIPLATEALYPKHKERIMAEKYPFVDRWISKQDLDKACAKEPNKLSHFKGAPIKGTGLDCNLNIDRVERVGVYD